MKIIPLPKLIVEKQGLLKFNQNLGVSCEYKNILDNLNDFIVYSFGYSLPKGDDIILLVDDKINLSDEGYILDISDKIIIKGKTEKGLFYGVQTLKQIIAEYSNSDPMFIPYVRIEDEPRFAYRGYMLDCCRHFFSAEIVKKCIEACALQKLNVFHWHLTEDQGWRIEIEKYPKLVEIGSKRKHTRNDKIEVSGYYTKQQIRDVIEFAKERYIEVTPEIDMPGHTTAAIASYPELWCKGTQIDVATNFGIKPEILCAGKETTYEFVNNVLDEVADLFPSKYIHLGGDEALKIEWEACPNCQAMIKKQGLKNTEELQAYFTNQAVKHLETLGKTPITWNESLNSGKLNENVIVQYWQDGKKPERVFNAVNNGRKIIMSKFSPYYLDYPYGMTSLKQTYKFEPYMEGINEDSHQNIWGVESPLWCEYVDTFEKIQYQTFPRLTAVAETGWTVSQHKDYESFISRLPVMKKVFNAYGLKMAPMKESNPNFFKGKHKFLKFLINAFDWESIKGGLVAMKETKKMRNATKENKK